MKKCCYCGFENAPEVLHCRDCGSQDFLGPAGKPQVRPRLEDIPVFRPVLFVQLGVALALMHIYFNQFSVMVLSLFRSITPVSGLSFLNTIFMISLSIAIFISTIFVLSKKYSFLRMLIVSQLLLCIHSAVYSYILVRGPHANHWLEASLLLFSIAVSISSFTSVILLTVAYMSYQCVD